MSLGLIFLFDGMEKKKSHHPYSREKEVLARKSDHDEVDPIRAKLKGCLLLLSGTWRFRLIVTFSGGIFLIRN